MTDNKENSATWRIITALGGAAAVASFIDKQEGAVRQWVFRDRIPAKYVVPLCKMTDGHFKPHQVRPDVFYPEG